MVAKKQSNSIHSVGRRKTSVARASVVKGSGKVRVNNQDFQEYVSGELLQLRLREPLVLSDMEGKLDVIIKVQGGGVNSQVEL